MIRLENVSFGYGITKIIDSVNLSITSGEIFLVLGPNSSGKTTLAKLLAGLIKPDQGKIIMDDQNIGYIPQGSGLISNRTILENLRLRPWYIGLAIEQELKNLCERFQIWQHKDSFPAYLSPGMRKRVSIVRALVCKPTILIADALTQELDSLEGLKTLKLFKETHDELGFTAVLFSAHVEAEKRIANRIAVLQNGTLQVASDTTEWLEEIAREQVHFGGS